MPPFNLKPQRKKKTPLCAGSAAKVPHRCGTPWRCGGNSAARAPAQAGLPGRPRQGGCQDVALNIEQSIYKYIYI